MNTIIINYADELSGKFKIHNEENELTVSGIFKISKDYENKDLITFKSDNQLYPVDYWVKFNEDNKDRKKEIQYFLLQQYT